MTRACRDAVDTVRVLSAPKDNRRIVECLNWLISQTFVLVEYSVSKYKLIIQKLIMKTDRKKKRNSSKILRIDGYTYYVKPTCNN